MTADMLTADELEALRDHAKDCRKFAWRTFGGAPPAAAEIDAERRSNEWWANHLAEMRKREACKS